MGWLGGIFDAKESTQGDKLSKEGKDGNYTYEKSGTYGQSDYTVRERSDGTYDVYVKSDSKKNHSHDHIDKDGNLLDNYHDTLIYMFLKLNDKKLSNATYTTNNDCIKETEKKLKTSGKVKTLVKK